MSIEKFNTLVKIRYLNETKKLRKLTKTEELEYNGLLSTMPKN